MQRLGAFPREDGLVELRLWAPSAGAVAVRIDGIEHALEREGDGTWSGSVESGPGADYVYLVDADELPDPCSRSQPDGARGPSRVVDARFGVRAGPALALEELVVYELHVGTFSKEGTFAGVVPHLDALAELGVTAIEVMPVATFPGERNWGYDGIFAFAPHAAYGGPEGLAELVDAAHEAGLGVILDVVYNHIGPTAPFPALGPWFTDRFETPWGAALNFAQEGVREWAIQNACMWVGDYRVDGLRLDAVYAIHDESETHVLEELARRVRQANPTALLISETEVGDFRPVVEWHHDAQWADAFHHELHTLLTGERDGYYSRYGTVSGLAREVEGKPAHRLVHCSQNHDQVGNRAVGDRPATDELELRAACLLFCPQVPLLFMGEEYGERRPFRYFTDHDDPLIADATRDGRRREFAGFAGFQGEVPDPQAPATFESSKLSREEVPGLRELYRDLLRLRRELPPEIETEADEDARTVRLRRGHAELEVDFRGRTWRLAA